MPHLIILLTQVIETVQITHHKLPQSDFGRRQFIALPLHIIQHHIPMQATLQTIKDMANQYVVYLLEM